MPPCFLCRAYSPTLCLPQIAIWVSSVYASFARERKIQRAAGRWNDLSSRFSRATLDRRGIFAILVLLSSANAALTRLIVQMLVYIKIMRERVRILQNAIKCSVFPLLFSKSYFLYHQMFLHFIRERYIFRVRYL